MSTSTRFLSTNLSSAVFRFPSGPCSLHAKPGYDWTCQEVRSERHRQQKVGGEFVGLTFRTFERRSVTVVGSHRVLLAARPNNGLHWHHPAVTMLFVSIIIVGVVVIASCSPSPFLHSRYFPTASCATQDELHRRFGIFASMLRNLVLQHEEYEKGVLLHLH